MRRTLFAAFALAAGVLTLTGCPKYPKCKKDKDCKAALGEKCVSGTCQNCKADTDCEGKAPEGQPPFVCTNFRCGPVPADGAVTEPGNLQEEGGPCTDRSNCAGGLACKEGVCALCSDNVECDPVECNLDTGRCAPDGQCQSDEQCAIDEICDGGLCVFSGDLGDDTGGPCGLAAVFFAFDSDIVTPKTQEDLAGVADCIANSGRQVFLEAHADNRGTEEYNILLTERRGNKVKNFLEEKGVSPEIMQVIAKGSLEATGSDEPSRAKDRRVQFIFPE